MINTDIKEKLNLALKQHQAGELQLAEAMYMEILETDPRNPDALHLLGEIFSQKKNYDSAIKYIEAAININPSANYFITLAKIYTCINNTDEAINCYLNLLSIKPDYVEVYNNLGNILSDVNRSDEAIECYLNAIKINPEYVDAYYNLGNTLLNNGETDSARNFYNLAIELKPDYTDAYYNIGAAFHLENNIQEAIKYYKKTVSLKPDHIDVYYNLATAYLIEKDFRNGWETYRKIRCLKQEMYNIDKSILKMQWNGESLENKTIYVFHEQGVGDTIFSARYLPVLNSMGATVIHKPQAGLEELFRHSNLKAEIIENAVPEDDISFDFHISMYYLLSILNINADNIPFQTGYLKADRNKTEYYRQKYFNNDNFKVGIVWHGNPELKYNKRRSVLPEKLSVFANIPNIKLYSLQKDSGTGKPLEIPPNITDIGSSFNDFSDTAAAIENLDLLISVDTSVTHLAGALGKRVWMLTPYSPDWRWFLDTDECLWYKSLKLFRQQQSGNWDDVIDRIYESLNIFSK